uniref:DUF2757 family protein n=1 Tax=Steinernema glaseri TaxID=37863 RepID=A0A1I7YXX9_9BILA
MQEVANAPEKPLLVATNLETLEVARVNLDFGDSGHIPCVDAHLTIKDSTLYICGKCVEYPLHCKNTHIYTFEVLYSQCAFTEKIYSTAGNTTVGGQLAGCLS